MIIKPIMMTEKDQRRFYEKVALPDENGCQMWLSGLDGNGYGQLSMGGRRGMPRKAHLIHWTIAYGDFPPGLEPDHTCERRRCVALDHLEWVTHAENMRRMGARRTHCQKGLHRWTDPGVSMLSPSGKRECRSCKNAGRRRQTTV